MKKISVYEVIYVLMIIGCKLSNNNEITTPKSYHDMTTLMET